MDQERAFLVFSNIFFLTSVGACIFLQIKLKLRWYSLLLEQAYLSSIVIASGLYHWCDIPGDSQYCYTDYTTLQNTDMIISYTIPHLIFTFTTDMHMGVFKLIYHVCVLLSNAIYVTQYKAADVNDYYYATIVVAGILTAIFRFTYLYYNSSPTTTEINCCNKRAHLRTTTGDEVEKVMKNEFNYYFGICAFLFAVAGFSFKFATPNTYEVYWWGHSMWHICISVSITFAMLMRYLPDCMRLGYQNSPVINNEEGTQLGGL